VTPHREQNGRKRLSDRTSGEQVTQAELKYYNCQITSKTTSPPSKPSLQEEILSDTHGNVNKKRDNRRGFQLKRQGKQQTATVAVTLAPGKIEPQ
jgi:hypothetical protein